LVEGNESKKALFSLRHWQEGCLSCSRKGLCPIAYLLLFWENKFCPLFLSKQDHDKDLSRQVYQFYPLQRNNLKYLQQKLAAQAKIGLCGDVQFILFLIFLSAMYVQGFPSSSISKADLLFLSYCFLSVFGIENLFAQS